MAKKPPADAGDAETWVQSLSWEDPLGYEMAPKFLILEDSMGRGAWCATLHGATKSQTQLSDWAHTYTHIADKNYNPIFQY